MKKKGFTLVELLAVIVIMAVLALIAIPITINIISDSRENTHKRSIENYGKAVESAYLESKMNRNSGLPNEVNIEDGVTIQELKKANLLKTNGKNVVCDETVNIIDPNTNSINLHDCYVAESNDMSKQKSKERYNYIDGKLEKIDDEKETTFKEYKVGDEIYDKTNNEKYYVIANSDKNTDVVFALKADALTYEEVSSYNSEHVKHSGYWGNEQGASDCNGYASVSYYASNDCWNSDHSGGNYNGCKADYNESDIKYIIDIWASKKFNNNELKKINNKKAHLIDQQSYHSIINYDWSVLNYGQYRTSYWTSAQYNSNEVFIVKNDGSLIHTPTDGRYYNVLIRPVINLYKNAIK